MIEASGILLARGAFAASSMVGLMALGACGNVQETTSKHHDSCQVEPGLTDVRFLHVSRYVASKAVNTGECVGTIYPPLGFDYGVLPHGAKMRVLCYRPAAPDKPPALFVAENQGQIAEAYVTKELASRESATFDRMTPCTPLITGEAPH